MKFSHLEFKEVKGVGSIEVDFTPDKRVYAFIGENGVGKTKFLEALFQMHLYTSTATKKVFNISSSHNLIFSTVVINHGIYFTLPYQQAGRVHRHQKKNSVDVEPVESKLDNYPIVFIAAQNRGFIQDSVEQDISTVGNFSKRRKKYIESLFKGMENKFSSLNMNTDIEQWFISIARTSNPFQKQRDNREIEIRTVLNLFHQMDQSVDPDFMEIDSDNRIFLKINNEVTQLSHLSTGYASILKIIQSIISGYGYFTNEQQLQHVRGIVLIDEIESHLHLSWQSKIIPTLKELFPNTTFYITTHSPVVLIQLEEGEAYRLQREEDGVVRSSIIHHPSNISFIDLQKRAFDLDLNKIKREQMSADSQKEANQALLDLINEEAVD